MNDLSAAAPTDSEGAALLAYELGELYERRLGDDSRALQAYQRALELDASLQPASWAARRILDHLGRWSEQAALLDRELARAAKDDRVTLMFDNALACGHAGADKEARTALAEVLRIAPDHQGALLELERIVVRARDVPAQLDVWERLANVSEQPERKVGYLLEVARHAPEEDEARARKALDAAGHVASGCAGALRFQLAERIARERVRIAETWRVEQHIEAAIEVLAHVLTTASVQPGQTPLRTIARYRELVALYRRQAQLARSYAPARSWDYLQRAHQLVSQEPVVLVDLIELAAELGRYDELPHLVERWQRCEDAVGRTAILSAWCAAAHVESARREHLRGLLTTAVVPAAPGFVLLTSLAECDALEDPTRMRSQLGLANAYLSAARAAADGTWLGPMFAKQREPRAAAALYVQAAELFAYSIATPEAIDQARAALDEASGVVSDHQAVIEAAIELDGIAGRTEQALARMRDANDRTNVERGIRISYKAGEPDSVLELQRRLVGLDPSDLSNAWCLEVLLAELQRDDERAIVLQRLARDDRDPVRRRTALLELASIQELGGVTGGAAIAVQTYREVLAEWPNLVVARDALTDLLRTQALWPELVEHRCAEARESSDPAAIRRAFREAAWVIEVAIDDAARAAELYAEWSTRLPGDRTALEGLARCRAAIGDHAGEVAPRAAIAEADAIAETVWLHARSLERANRTTEAAEQYRRLAVAESRSVASVSAMIALADIAARGADVAARIEADEMLAGGTESARLAAGLHENVGWMWLVGSRDHQRAATAFAAARELEPDRSATCLGAMLVSACQDDASAVSAVALELAEHEPATQLTPVLWLRSAALALAAGDVDICDERVAAALVAAPDSAVTLAVAAGAPPPKLGKTRDPFAVSARLVERAEVLAKRAELADEPEARRTWQLDRAEALELAGQTRDAAAALAAALIPGDWRAVTAWRRLAERVGDKSSVADASYVLAQLSRDREFKLQMLRDALAIYERDDNPDRDYALATCRRLAAVDPAAPEVERMNELLREGSKARELIDVLTEQLTHLAAQASPDEPKMIQLLLERAGCLYRLGREDLATADLEAILRNSPNHREALQHLADLAIAAGDIEKAIAACEQYLHRPKPEVAKLLARVLDEQTDAETTVVQPKQRRASVMRAATPDPFGGTTVLADLSFILAQERATRVGPSEFEANTLEAPPIFTAEELRVPSIDLDTSEHNAEIEPSLAGAVMLFPPERDLSGEESDVVMMSYDDLQSQKSDDTTADMLQQYEREIDQAIDPASTTALRIEAGRLREKIGELDAARAHYEAAALVDPRAPAALRGLRRLARIRGDVGEVVRLLAAEIAVASPRERDALLLYRLDLLMALGARGEASAIASDLLGRRPRDVHVLLARLELELREGNTAEVARCLDILGGELEDASLRAGACAARAALAMQAGDATAARTWSAAAAAADPDSPAMRLLAVRNAESSDNLGATLFDLACHVESDDPIAAAALSLRALQAGCKGDVVTDAVQLATHVAQRDALVARIATEVMLAPGGDRMVASHACSRWIHCKCPDAERAYAAARAAELEPDRLVRLWAQALELDPDDDYAAARVRTAHVAAGEMKQAIEFDLARAKRTERDFPLLRASHVYLGLGQTSVAIDLLARARAAAPASQRIAGSLDNALAVAGRWVDRARLQAELAADNEHAARDVARLRCAFAWERAAHDAIDSRNATREEIERIIVAAVEAWSSVLEDDPRSPIAHAAAIALSSRLSDPALQIDVLARAQAAQTSAWAASNLALRRARLLLGRDPRQAEEVARDAAQTVEDPRCTLVMMMGAARRGDLAEAATALEARAQRVDSQHEAAVLLLRAAQLLLEANDPQRALTLFGRVDASLPGLADDLIDVSLRRVSETTGTPRTSAASFSRTMHDADRAAERGDSEVALELYRRALQIRPTDPLAVAPLLRLAFALRDPDPIEAFAAEQMRTAEALDDPAAKADAFELIARTEKELRRNTDAAVLALAKAWKADATRNDLIQCLEYELILEARSGELLQLRERQLSFLDPKSRSIARDLVALNVDAAVLAIRDKRQDSTLEAFYRRVLEIDPHHRLALLQLEAILRRTGVSEELAALQEHLSNEVTDVRTKASLLTRAGETLAMLGRPGEAVQRFVRACDLMPSYVPTLELWHQTALENQLWLELAEAATRKAQLGGDSRTVAALHHFAGVVLMDKAKASELAIAAFRHALDSDPTDTDTFVRLRELYEAERRPGDLAALLQRRLDVERDSAAKIRLHCTLAEHWRDVGDREAALGEYRAVLKIDPAAVRAHAAIADIASEQLGWQTAADAVLARVPLETDPRILRTLHYRLGAIYADHDAPKAIDALRRALTIKPGDTDVLLRLADIAIAAADWKTALEACNQLIELERDPERRAGHYRRAAKVFGYGLGDRKRAESMLQHAAASAPAHGESALTLVDYYKDAGDVDGLHAHLGKVVAEARARIEREPRDGSAYRMLARAIVEKGHQPALPIARIAAELAQLLGVADEPERRLLAIPAQPDVATLVGDHERLFGGSEQLELREIFNLLGGAVAKHVGSDLGAYGLRRKDRLPPGDPAVASARDVALLLGCKELDIYVANNHPYMMVAEPTQPMSLVLGVAIASGDAGGVRFAAGAALKLAQLSLAIPARLSTSELGVLAAALVRIFRPELVVAGVDLAEADAQAAKLRRHASASSLDEARPHALLLAHVDHHAFARELKLAGLRAGVAASGSILPGLGILAASLGVSMETALGNAGVGGLISFALGDRSTMIDR